MKEKPDIVLPDYVKKQYVFTYKLTYKEVYDAYLQLSFKWNKKIYQLVLILLAVIAAGLLFGYFLDNQKVHYFFMAAMAIMLLFYQLYVPIIKAKKGASKTVKQGGTYKIIISSEGEVTLPQMVKISIAGDKDSRAVETDKIFVIRCDRTNTICLPKRIIKEQELEGLREIIKAYVKYQRR